jgi:MFS family permease
VIVLAQFLVLRRIEGHRRTRVRMVMTTVWIAAWTLLGLTGLVPATVTAALGVILFHVLFGFGETMLQPTVPAITNDLAPDHLRGRYNALSSGCFQAGGIAGPIVAGFLLRHDQTAAFIVLLVAGCASMFWLTLVLERRIPAHANGANGVEWPATEAESVLERPHPAVDTA